MPVYKYTAKDLTGKIVRGTKKSENISALMTELSEKQLFLMKSKEKNAESKRSKLTSAELADFSREIGTMLSAGVPLIRALNIIINRDNPEKQKKIYTELHQSLKKGLSFSEALKTQGTTFPDIFINMIIAGEASGQIDKTTLKMATYFEKENHLNSKVKSAMTYPTILFFVTIVVVIVIFTVVLPNFFTMFENIDLPLPTKIVIAISNAFVNYWYIILGVILLIIGAFTVLMQRSKVRISFDKRKLRIPKIKGLLKIIYTARFARTLSTLYESGLSLVNSIQTAQATVGNRYITSQFTEVINQVKSGVPLSKAIMKIDGFDSKLASVILIGEETGKLGDMLTSVADSYDYESEMATQRLVVLIEPAMLLFMAVIIGSIMLSVFMPILSIYKGIA